MNVRRQITQKGGELPSLVTATLVEEPFPPRWNGAPLRTFARFVVAGRDAHAREVASPPALPDRGGTE
jgi:hypothetical protein